MVSGVASGEERPWAAAAGATAAVLLHVALGLLVARVPPRSLVERTRPVEVDILDHVERAPEPREPPRLPAPSPAPLPPPAPPRVVHRRAAPKPPPVPNQEQPPPASAQPTPTPIFGVTDKSVVAGESPVALPIGNTLMTNDRTLAKAPPAPLPPAPRPETFAPIDEESVAQLPERMSVPQPAYPEMARRLGVEGKVRLRLGIDRRGNVKSVRVLQKGGYGMDEAAMAAAWQSKWKPARQEDGQPVDVVIHYDFTFRMPTR